jgi:hypothetical protein
MAGLSKSLNLWKKLTHGLCNKKGSTNFIKLSLLKIIINGNNNKMRSNSKTWTTDLIIKQLLLNHCK